jgi:hypothetical protein
MRMTRTKLRSRKEVVERALGLAGVLRGALVMLPAGENDPAVVDAVWQAEGLGMLLWALGLVELPPFDRPFDHERLLETGVAEGMLRPAEEIVHARETARLWHWRARTTLIRAEHEPELPASWQSYEQLVAATAMRGHDRGLLPRPVRGDFPAFGTGYRELEPDQYAEALSIAYERHRALNWLCGAGTSWDETPTDT